MRILVTNDDGIDSIGLHTLARAMTDLGEVVVAAPDREYSGAGAALGALHLLQPEVRRLHLDGLDEVWAVNGPPGLCVMFSRLGVFGEPFDLIVSGINPGANVGRSVYHSGTIGACLTGRNGGVSGVAVSQAVAGFGIEGQGWDDMLADQHWDAAAEVASVFVRSLLADLPSEPVVANLNIPNMAVSEMKGWCHCEIGSLPPRAMAEAHLEAVSGHEDLFTVKMSWGDAVPLPAGTDGGSIERDLISVTYLSAITAQHREDLPGLDQALDALFTSASPS